MRVTAALRVAARTLGLHLRVWPAPAGERCWAVYEVGDRYVGCVTWRGGELRAARPTQRTEQLMLDSLVRTALSIAPPSAASLRRD